MNGEIDFSDKTAGADYRAAANQKSNDLHVNLEGKSVTDSVIPISKDE